MSKRSTLKRSHLRRVLRLVVLMVCGSLTACASVAEAQTVLPEWASRSSRAWTGQPQLADRVERFARASEPEGRLREALLLCRVHVDGQYDLFADPDLRVRTRLGRRSVDWWGSENSRTEVFSVAGVSLRRGDRLSFRVVDRDVTFDDFIQTVDGRYDGGAIALRSGPAQIECRRVAQQEVDANRRDALQRAALAREQLESAEPDLTREHPGPPLVSTGPLVEAATWSGWAHPDVASARRAHLRAEAELRQAVARAVRRARQESPRPGEALDVDGGRVRVEALECGRRAQARMRPDDRFGHTCALVVRLEGDARLGRADLLMPDGTVVQTRTRYLDGEELGLVVLALPTRPPASALLRFGAERHLLRVR